MTKILFNLLGDKSRLFKWSIKSWTKLFRPRHKVETNFLFCHMGFHFRHKNKILNFFYYSRLPEAFLSIYWVPTDIWQYFPRAFCVFLEFQGLAHTPFCDIIQLWKPWGLLVTSVIFIEVIYDNLIFKLTLRTVRIVSYVRDGNREILGMINGKFGSNKSYFE